MHKCSSQSGVAIIEMALFFAATLFSIIAIIDLGRYFTIKALITKGAQEGLNVAAKLQNIDVDFPNTKSSEYKNEYKPALDQVINTTLELPRNIVHSATSISKRQRFILTLLDDGSKTESILVRPGERFISEDGSIIDHPSLCKDNSTEYCKTKPLPFPGQSMKVRLASHPLLVETRATFRPFLPFLQPFTVRGVAIGFREQVNISGFGLAPTTTTSTTSTTTSTSTSSTSTSSTSTTSTSTSSTTSTSTTSTSTTSTSKTSTSSTTTTSVRPTTSTSTSRTTTSSTTSTSTSRTTTSTSSTTSTSRTTTSSTSTTSTSTTSTSTTSSTTTTTISQCKDIDNYDDCYIVCGIRGTRDNPIFSIGCATTAEFHKENAPNCCTCRANGEFQCQFKDP